jgi:hypothetical protein
MPRRGPRRVTVPRHGRAVRTRHGAHYHIEANHRQTGGRHQATCHDQRSACHHSKQTGQERSPAMPGIRLAASAHRGRISEVDAALHSTDANGPAQARYALPCGVREPRASLEQDAVACGGLPHRGVFTRTRSAR